MTPDTAIHRHGMAFPPTREHLWRAADGMRLAVYDWKAINPRGVVLLVHGLGEHAMRYTHVAAWFVARGYAVRAYDQFGHGHSDGARGALLRDTQLVDHLAELVDATEAVGKQLILGHSLGGLVAATAVARGRRSFVNITPWPMNTSSSMVTPSQINVCEEILQRAPMAAFF